MDDDLNLALRYRNYAEELRVIASDKATPEIRQSLLSAAKSYDQVASSIEAIQKSKRAAGLR
jgi:hypothetical protein